MISIGESADPGSSKNSRISDRSLLNGLYTRDSMLRAFVRRALNRRKLYQPSDVSEPLGPGQRVSKQWIHMEPYAHWLLNYVGSKILENHKL